VPVSATPFYSEQRAGKPAKLPKAAQLSSAPKSGLTRRKGSLRQRRRCLWHGGVHGPARSHPLGASTGGTQPRGARWSDAAPPPRRSSRHPIREHATTHPAATASAAAGPDRCRSIGQAGRQAERKAAGAGEKEREKKKRARCVGWDHGLASEVVVDFEHTWSVERDAVHPCRGRPAHGTHERGPWRRWLWLGFHRAPFALTARPQTETVGAYHEDPGRVGGGGGANCQTPAPFFFPLFLSSATTSQQGKKKRLALSPRVSTTVLLWSFPSN